MSNLQGEDAAVPLQKTIEDMKQAIWKKRPILGEIMQKHGAKTIYEYSKDFLDINPTPKLDERKAELFQVTTELIEQRLGKSVAEGVQRQLLKKPLVSTIDHHGPITHPFFLNCNIISALPFLENKNDPDMHYEVVFSFSSVSVNNASAYPRGILFHGDTGKHQDIIRLPLLPDRFKMGVVYGMHGFTREDIDKAKKQLQEKIKSNEITEKLSQNITNILDTYFGNSDVLSTPDLCTQITKINYALWPAFFHGQTEFKNDLVYLDIETLVRELLIRFHLKNPNSLLYKVLFDPAYQKLVLKHFNNLPGAFSLENKTGTYFFWTMDDKLRRVGLQFHEDALWCDEAEHFDLTPDEVISHLEQKKILPSMLLCYLTVSLYYGMKCLGGFCQVHDLTMMKQAWQQILREAGELEEADAVEPLQTRELGGDGLVLSYIQMDASLTPATGIDMMLDAHDTTFEKYAEISKNVSLMEIMNTMLPEMYTVLYPSQEREEKFSQVSLSHIMKETGIEEKLKKFI